MESFALGAASLRVPYPRPPGPASSGDNRPAIEGKGRRIDPVRVPIEGEQFEVCPQCR